MYPNTPAAIAPSADVPLAAWEIELLAGERWDVRFGDLITLNGGTYRVVDADGKPILEPEPPRIEEPGLWGVVEAGYAKYLPESGITYKFAKHDRYWISKSFPQLAAPWDDLIDPTLIREGLES